ncbi:MAG: MBOAT family protein [Gammaproteobacteria bacterium]|nr:MBOAT family protein [Gammaproteobacteria bacterium]
MLFNSVEFIFLFLPVTFVGFYWLKFSNKPLIAIRWLVFASLFFYAWWDPKLIWIILISVLFNFYIGQAILKWERRYLLILGIIGNLALLAYFKYFNFIIDNINLAFSSNYSFEKIILPIAISFFTFQQIAYLVDTYKGKTQKHSLLQHCLFVAFFPQLIAGPIVHHKEMFPQFETLARSEIRFDYIAWGCTIFSIGLFKKVVLADNLSLHVDPYFSASANSTILTFYEAWLAALAYSLQIYFDFSGYSDMAIGLALLFGIRLPINFLSPYKAGSIIDFWHRWHMTLSRFLRDYLYFPLGGNRKGIVRRYINLLLTMLLGGLWHGANWTFVCWGGLHGLYLVVNHAWRYIKSFIGLKNNDHKTTITGICITFIAVTISWVFFRSDSIASAIELLRSMFGFNGISLPQLFSNIPLLGEYEQLNFGFIFVHDLSNSVEGIIWVVLSAIILWLLPNTAQIYTGTLLRTENIIKSHRITWKPDILWASFSAIVFVGSILFINSIEEFIYFQF